MTRRRVELIVGLGLLLGPLGYALTLEPQVETVAVPVPVEVERVVYLPTEVVPELPPAPAVEAPPTPELAPAPQPESRIEFAFVNAAGLVLSTEAETSWGHGWLRKHEGPGEYRAAKRADAAEIPEALWAQRGRTFDLYGKDGKLCSVRLGDLAVLAQHDGPSLYELFHGDYGEVDWDEFHQEAITPQQIRREVWSQAKTEGAWLVAEIVGDDSCEGAMWARDSELPPPELLTASTARSPLTERRVAQLRASEELATMRTEFEKWNADPESYGEYDYADGWATIEKEFPPTTTTWHDADGEARVLELEFGHVGSWCGDGFDSSIDSLELVDGESLIATEHAVDPVAIFDADGDGRFELLYQDDDAAAPNRLQSESELSSTWYVPRVFICPC